MSPSKSPWPNVSLLWVATSLMVIVYGCVMVTSSLDQVPQDQEGSTRFETLVLSNFAQAIRPVAVAMAPFRIGRPPDIAVAMWGDPDASRQGSVEEGSLAILLAQEGVPLRFVAGQELPSGLSPASIGVGDFNGDKILDVAVVNLNGRPRSAEEPPGQLAVFLGKGDGTFQREWLFPSAWPFPAGIAVADFDGNGYEDIAIGNNTRDVSGISVFLFGPSGLLRQNNLHTGGTISRSIAVGDFNGDRVPDIAVANLGDSDRPETAGVTVFVSDGRGQFQRHFLQMSDSPPLGIVAGRFTSNRFHDLAVLCKLHLRVLASAGDGSFREVMRIAGVTAGGFNFQAIQTADFDRDGNADVVFLENDFQAKISAVVVLLGDGRGHFKKRLELSRNAKGQNARFVQAVSFGNLAVADIDRDGYPDIVVTGISFDFIEAYIKDRSTARLREDAKGLAFVFLNRLVSPR